MNYKGGKIKRTGYWYIKKLTHPFCGKQGYVAEHRLVMEKYLGRYLKPEEVVHHINHIITDNRIENLKLYATHGQHTKEAHPEIAKKQRILFKGQHHSPKTEFKKEHKTWNKGLTGSKSHVFGMKMSKETIIKMRKAAKKRERKKRLLKSLGQYIFSVEWFL